MKLITGLALIVVCSSFTNFLPKKCWGHYTGERPAYQFVKDDLEMTVDKHDISIVIIEERITYQNGGLILTGPYEYIKNSGSEYIVIAKLTNGKSINFELEFVINNKQERLYLKGKNGEPDVSLERVFD